jgi:hypothetical protein
VCTADMFVAVQYLANAQDAEYAERCRQALLSSVGRVVFPPIPSAAEGEHGATQDQPMP